MANKERVHNNGDLLKLLDGVTDLKKLTKEANDIIFQTINATMPKSSKYKLAAEPVFFVVSRCVEISTEHTNHWLDLHRANEQSSMLGDESIKLYKRISTAVSKALVEASKNGIQLLKDRKDRSKHYTTEEEWKKLSRMHYNGRSTEEIIAYLQALI